MSNLERDPHETPCGGVTTAVQPAHELLEGRDVLLGRYAMVRRFLPHRDRRMVGAWSFVDHYGPDDVTGGPGDRRPTSSGLGRLGDVERVALGFCARTGSAVAVAITPTMLLGRWTVDLTDGRVPGQVFHAVQGWERAAAVRYVDEATGVVRDVAARRLREVIAGLPGVVAVGVVTGDRELPVTAARVLESHPLMHAAEGQLYRDALLDAAAEEGMAVTALPRRVADERLRAGTLVAETVQRLGELAGPPWRKDHKRATAAALAALEPATATPAGVG